MAGEERRYALVTGASQGLGRCYALELARCGIDTVLVSLPDSGLNEVVIEAEFSLSESRYPASAYALLRKRNDGMLDALSRPVVFVPEELLP